LKKRNNPRYAIGIRHILHDLQELIKNKFRMHV